MTLEFTGDVTLADPQVITDLPLPDTSYADLTIRAEVTNHADEPCRAVLRGTLDGGIGFSLPVDLAAGETRTVNCTPAECPALRIEEPRLWWPNGYGPQELYTLQLAVEQDGVRSMRSRFVSASGNLPMS